MSAVTLASDLDTLKYQPSTNFIPKRMDREDVKVVVAEKCPHLDQHHVIDFVAQAHVSTYTHKRTQKQAVAISPRDDTDRSRNLVHGDRTVWEDVLAAVLDHSQPDAVAGYPVEVPTTVQTKPSSAITRPLGVCRNATEEKEGEARGEHTASW